MPTLTIPHSFVAGTTIESAKVNANFAAIATLLNTTKLSGTDNLQDSSVGSRHVDLTSGATSLGSDTIVLGGGSNTTDILSTNITPTVASYAFVYITADLKLEATSTTLDVAATATLRVDGANEASGTSAYLEGQWSGLNSALHILRGSVSASYRTPLTAASHTLLVRVANLSTVGGLTIAAFNTKLIYFLIAQ